MQTIQVDFTDSYRYSFSSTLNNKNYQFTLMWNNILEAFFLDMMGDTNKYSIPIAPGMVKEIDSGVYVSIQKGDDSYKEKVNPDNLNTEYFLLFADESDFHGLSTSN